MKTETFRIRIYDHGAHTLKLVNGSMILIKDFPYQFTAHKNKSAWTISEYLTGFGVIFNADTKKEAIDRLNDKLKEIPLSKWNSRIHSIITNHGQANKTPLPCVNRTEANNQPPGKEQESCTTETDENQSLCC